MRYEVSDGMIEIVVELVQIQMKLYGDTIDQALEVITDHLPGLAFSMEEVRGHTEDSKSLRTIIADLENRGPIHDHIITQLKESK